MTGQVRPGRCRGAARSALARHRTGTPKLRAGKVEALRNLRVARRSAVTQRADVQRQMKALIVTAPDQLRTRLRNLGIRELIEVCATAGPDLAQAGAPATAATLALRALAGEARAADAAVAAWVLVEVLLAVVLGPKP